MISAGKRPQTYALDRAATGTVKRIRIKPLNPISRVAVITTLFRLGSRKRPTFRVGQPLWVQTTWFEIERYPRGFTSLSALFRRLKALPAFLPFSAVKCEFGEKEEMFYCLIYFSIFFYIGFTLFRFLNWTSRECYRSLCSRVAPRTRSETAGHLNL